MPTPGQPTACEGHAPEGSEEVAVAKAATASRLGSSACRASTCRASTCRASTCRSVKSASLGVSPPLEDLGRRLEVWLGFAALTTAWVVVLYAVSDDICYLAYGQYDRSYLWLHTSVVLHVQVVTGSALLCCFIDHRGRFNASLPLHIWSRRWAILAMLDAYSRSMALAIYCQSEDRSIYGAYLYIVSDLAWLLQAGITCWLAILKLDALGQTGFARTSRWLFASAVLLAAILGGWSAASVVWSLPGIDMRRRPVAYVFFCSLPVSFHIGFMTSVTWGMLGAARAAQKALRDRSSGEVSRIPSATLQLASVPEVKVVRGARALRAIRWTQMTAVVTMLSGLVSMTLGITIMTRHGQCKFSMEVPLSHVGWMKAVDFIVGCLQTVILSGMVGPEKLRYSEEAFARVGQLGGFALRETRRIAFQGRVNSGGSKCVVSFPGVYADLWDRVVRLRSRQASVACVFLTDSTSGLGQHAPDPDNPQHRCYCRRIYAPLPPAAYLRVVPRPPADMDPQEYQRRLAFERADAAAMGAHLLVESEHSRFLWARAQSRGLQKAEQLCCASGGCAPWGCMWFAKWIENVEQAVERGQELLVFFKEGAAGKGKLSWDVLTDPDCVSMAADDGGLGSSQRAEVAWLDHKGYKYTEIDVLDFESVFPQLD